MKVLTGFVARLENATVDKRMTDELEKETKYVDDASKSEAPYNKIPRIAKVKQEEKYRP